MRRAIQLGVVLVAVSGLSGAVVYENGSNPSNSVEDSRLGITSASSAGASAAVGPNGTAWRAEVSMTDSACRTGNVSAVRNVTRGTEDGKNRISFEGTVSTSNPCHTLQHEVEKTGNSSFTLNISSEQQIGTCAQCLGAVSYEASFTAAGDYNLTVLHDGREVDTLNYAEEDQSEKVSSGALLDLMNWLKRLL